MEKLETRIRIRSIVLPKNVSKIQRKDVQNCAMTSNDARVGGITSEESKQEKDWVPKMRTL